MCTDLCFLAFFRIFRQILSFSQNIETAKDEVATKFTHRFLQLQYQYFDKSMGMGQEMKNVMFSSEKILILMVPMV